MSLMRGLFGNLSTLSEHIRASATSIIFGRTQRSRNGTGGRLAILIDSENIPPHLMPVLLQEAANYGQVSLKRAYANWRAPAMRKWSIALGTHSIQPIQSDLTRASQNRSDYALIEDAMKLLGEGSYSGFGIVSNDGDFEDIAKTIRQEGIPVYGFGMQNASKQLVKACDKFVYLVPTVPRAPRNMKHKPPPSMDFFSSPSTTSITSCKVLVSSSWHLVLERKDIPESVLRQIEVVIRQCIRHDGDYVKVIDVGQGLLASSPVVNAREYGYHELCEFLTDSNVAEVRLSKLPDGRQVALTRLKTQEEEEEETKLAI